MEERRGISVLLLFLTACIWISSLWVRLELLQTGRSLLSAEHELAELREEEHLLRSGLYEPMKLEELEEKALQLGMERPRREQLAGVERVLPDKVTLCEPNGDRNGIFQRLQDRYRSCFAP
ncbi:MAG: hypothetical protein MJ074_06295 [Oscillospiraceae bacterium]|nr:hypothetical protein [Oscillospiraceae bacterium]